SERSAIVALCGGVHLGRPEALEERDGSSGTLARARTTSRSRAAATEARAASATARQGVPIEAIPGAVRRGGGRARRWRRRDRVHGERGFESRQCGGACLRPG